MKNKKKYMGMVVGITTCLLVMSCNVMGAETDFEFDSSDYALTAYHGIGGELLIPDELEGCPVESISSSVFYGNKDISSMVLPETLLTLEGMNFYFMDNLTSVILPESLVVIDSYNFFSCSAIAEVTIPARVTFIGDNSFNSCDNLRTIRFEGAAPVVGMECFAYLPDDAVAYVPENQMEAYGAILPEEIEIISTGENAVICDYTASEDEFVIDPETGTILEYTGFAVRVDIPETIQGTTVSAIGEDAFSSHRYMYYVTIPEGVISIGDRAFENAQHLSWVDLPSTLKSIGDQAFAAYHGSAVDLPEGLETIGVEGFARSSLTKALYLPEGLKEIGDRAFYWIYSPDIYFPSTIEYIGEEVFKDSYVSYLYFEGKELPEIANTAFDGISISDVDLNWEASYEQMVEAQNVFDGLGQSARVWRLQNPYVDYMYDGLDTYENGVFTGYTGTQTHIRPWDADYEDITVTAIADGALKENQIVEYFAVPYNDEFTTIGKEAFAGSSVQTVDLFDSVTTIGENAFKDCTALTEIYMSEKVTVIEADTFAGCTALTEISLPEGVTSIGSEAFAGCTALTEISLPEGVTSIGSEAFAGCTALTEIVLPNSVTSIGAGAFAGCECLTRIILSPEAEGVDENAFEGISYEYLCVSDDASEEQVKAWNVKLNTPWYDPVERVSEYKTFAVMPYEETAPADFWYDSEYERMDDYRGYELNLYLPREIEDVQMKMLSANVLNSAKNTWGEVSLPVKSVVIPETITEWVYGVFSDCADLEVVICYAPLENLPESAFANCTSLRQVIFVNGVKNIDMGAFQNCPALEAVYLGYYQTNIHETAFDEGFEGVITELPDLDALLEEVKCEPLPTPVEEATTPLPELDITQAAPYLGTWNATTMVMEGSSIDLAELGMFYTMILKEDGTAILNISGDMAMGTWCVIDGMVYVGEYLEEAMQGTLGEDDILTMAEYGDEIIFVRGEDDGMTDAAFNVVETNIVTADNSVTETGDYLETKFVCTEFESAGTKLDASMLGAEYSVIFHEDGTLKFVMAGADVPGLRWEAKTVTTDAGSVDAYTVVYFDGSDLNFILTEDGLELNFFGSMILYFEIES